MIGSFLTPIVAMARPKSISRRRLARSHRVI
jgi:hypothetical protein